MILISYLPGQVHQVRQRQLVHLRGLKKLSKVGEIFKRLLIQCDHAPGPQYSSLITLLVERLSFPLMQHSPVCSHVKLDKLTKVGDIFKRLLI